MAPIAGHHNASVHGLDSSELSPAQLGQDVHLSQSAFDAISVSALQPWHVSSSMKPDDSDLAEACMFLMMGVKLFSEVDGDNTTKHFFEDIFGCPAEYPHGQENAKNVAHLMSQFYMVAHVWLYRHATSSMSVERYTDGRIFSDALGFNGKTLAKRLKDPTYVIGGFQLNIQTLTGVSDAAFERAATSCIAVLNTVSKQDSMAMGEDHVALSKIVRSVMVAAIATQRLRMQIRRNDAQAAKLEFCIAHDELNAEFKALEATVTSKQNAADDAEDAVTAATTKKTSAQTAFDDAAEALTDHDADSAAATAKLTKDADDRKNVIDKFKDDVNDSRAQLTSAMQNIGSASNVELVDQSLKTVVDAFIKTPTKANAAIATLTATDHTSLDAEIEAARSTFSTYVTATEVEITNYSTQRNNQVAATKSKKDKQENEHPAAVSNLKGILTATAAATSDVATVAANEHGAAKTEHDDARSEAETKQLQDVAAAKAAYEAPITDAQKTVLGERIDTGLTLANGFTQTGPAKTYATQAAAYAASLDAEDQIESKVDDDKNYLGAHTQPQVELEATFNNVGIGGSTVIGALPFSENHENASFHGSFFSVEQATRCSDGCDRYTGGDGIAHESEFIQTFEDGTSQLDSEVFIVLKGDYDAISKDRDDVTRKTVGNLGTSRAAHNTAKSAAESDLATVLGTEDKPGLTAYLAAATQVKVDAQSTHDGDNNTEGSRTKKQEDLAEELADATSDYESDVARMDQYDVAMNATVAAFEEATRGDWVRVRNELEEQQSDAESAKTQAVAANKALYDAQIVLINGEIVSTTADQQGVVDGLKAKIKASDDGREDRRVAWVTLVSNADAAVLTKHTAQSEAAGEIKTANDAALQALGAAQAAAKAARESGTSDALAAAKTAADNALAADKVPIRTFAEDTVGGKTVSIAGASGEMVMSVSDVIDVAPPTDSLKGVYEAAKTKSDEYETQARDVVLGEHFARLNDLHQAADGCSVLMEPLAEKIKEATATAEEIQRHDELRDAHFGHKAHIEVINLREQEKERIITNKDKAVQRTTDAKTALDAGIASLHAQVAAANQTHDGKVQAATDAHGRSGESNAALDKEEKELYEATEEQYTGEYEAAQPGPDNMWYGQVLAPGEGTDNEALTAAKSARAALGSDFFSEMMPEMSYPAEVTIQQTKAADQQKLESEEKKLQPNEGTGPMLAAVAIKAALQAFYTSSETEDKATNDFEGVLAEQKKALPATQVAIGELLPKAVVEAEKEVHVQAAKKLVEDAKAVIDGEIGNWTGEIFDALGESFQTWNSKPSAKLLTPSTLRLAVDDYKHVFEKARDDLNAMWTGGQIKSGTVQLPFDGEPQNQLDSHPWTEGIAHTVADSETYKNRTTFITGASQAKIEADGASVLAAFDNAHVVKLSGLTATITSLNSQIAAAKQTKIDAIATAYAAETAADATATAAYDAAMKALYVEAKKILAWMNAIAARADKFVTAFESAVSDIEEAAEQTFEEAAAQAISDLVSIKAALKVLWDAAKAEDPVGDENVSIMQAKKSTMDGKKIASDAASEANTQAQAQVYHMNNPAVAPAASEAGKQYAAQQSEIQALEAEISSCAQNMSDIYYGLLSEPNVTALSALSAHKTEITSKASTIQQQQQQQSDTVRTTLSQSKVTAQAHLATASGDLAATQQAAHIADGRVLVAANAVQDYKDRSRIQEWTDKLAEYKMPGETGLARVARMAPGLYARSLVKQNNPIFAEPQRLVTLAMGDLDKIPGFKKVYQDAVAALDADLALMDTTAW